VIESDERRDSPTIQDAPTTTRLVTISGESPSPRASETAITTPAIATQNLRDFTKFLSFSIFHFPLKKYKAGGLSPAQPKLN
jgi:hypothetical protein|tara:strand:+ start:132 stop:377 length:246 start_codon:yes stop_codon:yes gene_type:complete